MVTKTITITQDAYNALASNKQPGESFSQLILRTHKKKGDIGQFFGIWADKPQKDIDAMHRIVEQGRKRAGKQRTRELLKQLK